MKGKFFITVCSLMMIALSVSAQNNQRNIFGVRAGINGTTIHTRNLMPDSGRRAKIGWSAGITDQILLLYTRPLYLEVGAMLSNKGGGSFQKVNSVRYRERYGMTFLQIPVCVNYHIYLGAVSLEPYFGFYYACALWGNHTSVTRGGGVQRSRTVSSIDFGDGFSRSDVGISLGLGWSWSKEYISMGWERGFVNMSKMEGVKYINNSNFTITLGHNF